MKIVNWDLLKNPINWFTVLFMVIIFGFAADIIVRKFSDKEQ